MIKRIIRDICFVAMALMALGLIFFIISFIFDYRPKAREDIFSANIIPSPIPDSISILSWNIGYGGLGDNMDFFYDGGTMVRDTKERTEENIDAIIKTLKKHQADIMLLQEVDLNSHRTYRIDEVKRLSDEFPDYMVFFAYNYKSWAVPIPIREPIGRVESGVVILSKFLPIEAYRLQYPSRFPFPISMFNLKRCLLCASYLTSSGDTLTIGNTHNTAFDTGSMRSIEMKYLEALVQEDAAKGNIIVIGGDWNQYPPSYHPEPEELENPYFAPVMISDTLLRRYGRLETDTTVRSLRFNNRPFSPKSIRTTTDLFFIPHEITTSSLYTEDLLYKNSDHNPVILRIKLKNNK